MIRPYGPGKFNRVIDSYVHTLSLDGTGDECGDVETCNHYCTVLLGPDGAQAARDEAEREGDTLTAEEVKFLRRQYGAIVEEDSQGFVTVAYFSTRNALEKKWAEIEAEVAAVEDEP